MKPPDQVKRELVRQWLARAEEDFGVAQHLLSGDAPYWASVAFHAQQAAEKSLKAILVHYQIEFPKTHDLGELLDRIARADAPLAASLRDADALTPYGVDVRYPGDLPDVTPDEARAAINLAAAVREAAQSLLKNDT